MATGKTKASSATSERTGMSIVAGVDGCRGGWIALLKDMDGITPPAFVLCPSFRDVLDLGAIIITIDMPIGFPDFMEAGGRGADLQARAILGPRKSSVFPAPARPALMATSYEEACEINRDCTNPPRALSQQSFNLFRKMREIDMAMTPALQERIHESHPEFAFCMLNDVEPLPHSKKDPVGAAERQALLEDAGFESTLLTGRPFPRSKVTADDMLDAAVLALVAEKIHKGTARRVPRDPARDAKGLRMEIWG